MSIITERAVLSHLLDQHPRRLTLNELAAEIGEERDETMIVRAVANLCAASFLVRDGTELVPAPEAVLFDRLGTAEGQGR